MFDKFKFIIKSISLFAPGKALNLLSVEPFDAAKALRSKLLILEYLIFLLAIPIDSITYFPFIWLPLSFKTESGIREIKSSYLIFNLFMFLFFKKSKLSESNKFDKLLNLD